MQGLQRERHVLAVFPHPDDETFGKAGTLALYARMGTPVTLVCGTLGEMGRNMGKPFFANRETLPKIREQELRNACKVIGIQDLRLLGLRDKTVEFEDPEAVADRIEAIIRELKPSVLMTYYPGHGVHPDHNALAWAAVKAVGRLPAAERPRVMASPVTRNPREVLGPPDVEVDVEPVLDVKLAAYRAHRSQSEGMMKQWEDRMASDAAAREEFLRMMRTEVYWYYPV
ncbi:MAG: bacillithiol biosynthesis deacetylase BshB2 [Alicyclobacillaceae bacterium]|nr:bacillithiol biosynthesis deacetylase BshB2 [Alicyclobacillaceae bacterium]